jgi:hypothetical protein
LLNHQLGSWLHDVLSGCVLALQRLMGACWVLKTEVEEYPPFLTIAAIFVPVRRSRNVLSF